MRKFIPSITEINRFFTAEDIVSVMNKASHHKGFEESIEHYRPSQTKVKEYSSTMAGKIEITEPVNDLQLRRYWPEVKELKNIQLLKITLQQSVNSMETLRDFEKLSSLRILELTDSSFDGKLPDWIFMAPKLEKIILYQVTVKPSGSNTYQTLKKTDFPKNFDITKIEGNYGLMTTTICRKAGGYQLFLKNFTIAFPRYIPIIYQSLILVVYRLMLSLYLHIPFCAQKCAYCSFTSFPNIEKNITEKYLAELKREIAHYGKFFPNEEIKTIYIGGGTPNLIGADNIISLIDEIKKYFNTESVAEYSFEFNPFPQEEIYTIIKKLNAIYAKESRVRFSFGIQSLDDKVLASAGRPSSFGQIVDFLRGLRQYKQENNVFNFDFIAFGKFNETRSGNLQLRDQSKLKFFENFVHSGFADSFSLYTLELSEGSKRYIPQKNVKDIKSECEDDLISEEFQMLKAILLEAGYHRYEVSNFAHPSKNSIHNMAYRTMENYLGLGLASSSFLDKDHAEKLGFDNMIRFTNTKNLNDYLDGSYRRSNATSLHETILMTHTDYLIEKFFLNFRTNQGIKDITEFKEILVPNYETKMKNYEEKGFIAMKKDGRLCLTDTGMDVFNTIITDLMQEI